MDPSINEIVTMISQVGFPIVVAGYCLYKLDKTMDRVALGLERVLERLGVDSES